MLVYRESFVSPGGGSSFCPRPEMWVVRTKRLVHEDGIWAREPLGLGPCYLVKGS